MPRLLCRLFLVGWLATTLTACIGSWGSAGPQLVQAKDLQRNTERAEELNRCGLDDLHGNDLDGAEKQFSQALEADIMFGPAHNNLGKVYYAQKKLYQAAWEFEYAAKLMPGRPEPKNNLGMVFEAAGKLDQAIESYTQALGMEPDNPGVLANLCRARVRHGDKDKSIIEQLRQLVMKDSRPEWVSWAKERLAILGGGAAQ